MRGLIDPDQAWRVLFAAWQTRYGVEQVDGARVQLLRQLALDQATESVGQPGVRGIKRHDKANQRHVTIQRARDHGDVGNIGRLAQQDFEFRRFHPLPVNFDLAVLATDKLDEVPVDKPHEITRFEYSEIRQFRVRHDGSRNTGAIPPVAQRHEGASNDQFTFLAGFGRTPIGGSQSVSDTRMHHPDRNSARLCAEFARRIPECSRRFR